MNIGDRLLDNEPIMYSGRRILNIIGIDENHVEAQQGNLHSVRIRKDRIFTDGKQRRSGFTLLGKE